MEERITIDRSKCTNCLLCAEVCLLGTFAIGDDGNPAVNEDAHCMGCGHCLAVCPTGAITHDRVGQAPDRPAEVATYDQLLGLLSMRRSHRNYKPDPVPREVIQKLLDAAVQAPNGLNSQTVHYTIITDAGVRKQLVDRAMLAVRRMMKLLNSPVSGFLFRAMNRRLFEGLGALMPEIELMIPAAAEGRDVVLYDAPCTIIIHTPKSEICGPEDAVYCAANILAAAEALGLGTCVIGFISGPMNHDPEMKRIAGIPPDHAVYTAMAVGYPRFRYSRPAPKMPAKVAFMGNDGGS